MRDRLRTTKRLGGDTDTDLVENAWGKGQKTTVTMSGPCPCLSLPPALPFLWYIEAHINYAPLVGLGFLRMETPHLLSLLPPLLRRIKTSGQQDGGE